MKKVTITLDPDAEALIRKLIRERGLSLTRAVNHAIRAGLAPQREGGGFKTPTFRMGSAKRLPTDKTLRLAGDLEDEETARKLSAG